MRLAVIKPEDSFDYGERIAERAGFDGEVLMTRPHADEEPPAGVDGVVVTGSPRHVYDRPDWMAQTQFYLRQQLRSDVPVLGICYGHQLLADTLGGTVERADEREFGYNEVQIIEQDPLFDGVPERFTTFTSHQDVVTELPPGTTRLAENEYGLQAFRSDVFPAWGIQFHPEYTLAMAERLLSQKDLPADEHERYAEGLTEDNAAAAQTACRVLENFIERC